MPLVTVVTPSYNQGDFIEATIQSVFTQDYPNIEYIIVDGGSNDKTLEVIQRYSDRLAWLSEPDNGQSDAINKGLKLAKGTILTYLNSDDLLLPGAVTAIVNHFIEHPETCAIYGDCQLINEQGSSIGVLEGRPFAVQAAFSGNQAMPQPGMFWRRAVTDQIGEFDTALHYTMDMDYWLRMAMVGCLPVYLPGMRSAFRLHANSKTVSQRKGFAQDWQVMAEKLMTVPNLSPDMRAFYPNMMMRARWETVMVLQDAGDLPALRRILREILLHETLRRRLLAGALYIDSYLHTHLGSQLQRLQSFLYRTRS